MSANFHRALRCAANAGGLVFAVLTASSVNAGFNVTSIGGNATTASIQATVDGFRTSLGNPNNGNNAGPISGGRREINWDGGGATVAAVTAGSLTAFQNTRGATFTTPGTGFLQTPLTDTALTSINASYSTVFSTFSPQRIFTPTGSNITDTIFSLPGSGGTTPATVTSFGAVFSDVDLANTTSIELFNSSDTSLGKFFAPAATVSSGGLSFLGLIANAGERIARVRVTTGNSALGPNDVPFDGAEVVVMDDFLYGEPAVVPEPTSAVLALFGAGSLLLRVRRGRFARPLRADAWAASE